MKRLFFAAFAAAGLVCAQNAALAPVARQQFFDANGAPLAGGMLYTCTAGASCAPSYAGDPPLNPLATYTDSTAGTPNANPILLDSAGRANVWLGAGAYKLVLEDANGGNIWTQDGVASTSMKAVTTTTGAVSNFNVPGTLTAGSIVGPVTYTYPGGTARTEAAKLNDTVSVKDFGAVCNGSTTDNTAFANALATGKAVLVPSGSTCVVDSLELPSSSYLIGASNQTSVLKPGASGTIFTITGAQGAHKSAISIRNLAFASASGTDTTGRAIAATYADNVTIADNTATEIELFGANVGLTYAGASVSSLNKNTLFSGNTCTSAQTAALACGQFRYVDGVTATGNRIYGYHDALYFWGGDANANGAIANTRWAQNIKFSENYASGSVGGFWGSMGQNVIISASSGLNVGDVAFDVEGTQGAIISGNTCLNATNACYAAFFLNKGIVFSANTGTQPTASQPIFRVWNSGLTLGNQDIVLVGNTFVCTDAVSMCVVDNGGGPAQRIALDGNSLTDTVLAFGAANNQGDLYITNNKLLFDRTFTGSAIAAQTSTGYTAYVHDNKIRSTVSQTSPTAISVLDSDFNRSDYYSVERNIAINFSAGIATATSGGNAGTTATFALSDNILGSGTITSSNTGAQQSVVVKNQFVQTDASGATLTGSMNATTGFRYNGTAGLTVVKNVTGSTGSACTMTFSGGILTASTCP